MSYCTSRRLELTNLIANLTNELEKAQRNNAPETILFEKQLKLEQLQNLMALYGDCGD